MIGRDAELARLVAALDPDRPGLVLLVGGPRTGKGMLLRALHERAGERRCWLFPSDFSLAGEAPWLVVDRQLTVEDFARATAPPEDLPMSSCPPRRRDLDLISVYGYRPDEDLHRWIVEERLPGLARSSPPGVVVVAGGATDLAPLEPLAVERIELGLLPRNAVAAELRAIDAGIVDHLGDGELDAYVDAVVGDPALLGALRHLLPLTMSPEGAAAPGEMR